MFINVPRELTDSSSGYSLTAAACFFVGFSLPLKMKAVMFL
jgi:hypothetical protein